MQGLSQRPGDDLAIFSIAIAQAKNDPEIRQAILADGSYRTIWPLIIDQNDKPQAVGDTHRMNDITREELSSTLSAIEERMDKRVERMEASEDRRAEAYRREQEARDRLYAERFEATSRRLEDRDKVIDSKLDAMSSAVLRMSEKVDGFEKVLDSKLADVKSSNRNAAWAMLAIAAATVVGIWGVNSTIVGSVTGFFDAGKASSQAQQDIEKLVKDSKLQSEETFKLLQQIQAQQQSAQKVPEPAKAPTQ